MRVLIGCESSGVVREAFRALGHDAWSCDILPADGGSEYHLQCDVLEVLDRGWDLGVFHPPCTYLTVSANGAFKGPDGFCKNGNKRGPWRHEEVTKAVEFAKALWNSPIKKKALENPVGRLSTLWMPPSQTIQPWQFGHPEFKGTCLWLQNLPNLEYTDVLTPPDKDTDPEEFKRWSKVHNMTPGPLRWKERSKTYDGIARAMASQWG